MPMNKLTKDVLAARDAGRASPAVRISESVLLELWAVQTAQ